jgi:hypothetical protein
LRGHRTLGDSVSRPITGRTRTEFIMQLVIYHAKTVSM